ncbi:DoxX family protein [Bradyrhizobium sp. WD16]|uniref:DoxX family protein n=1 Tax=Bradyrhizobium sp. WD16 TaxID=1521768 RepID=UPI0020A5FF4F|nr:DoxX family protein [Bradyrhizobium sp. WD16]UTD26115.1 LysR family transcriptional regulator [Bradyrhizobium sp. WD16]
MTSLALDSKSNGKSGSALAAALPLVGRLMLALIFVLSGVGKIFAPEQTQAYIAAAGLPLPAVAYGAAVLVELAGGVLLAVGYRTRAAALVLAAFSVVAALGFHSHFADQNQMIHFLKNIAIAGGLLQVVAFGAGGFSLDGRAR